MLDTFWHPWFLCFVRRFSLSLVHLAIIVAMSVGSGAHWMAIQTVAWTTMLVDYSKGETLMEAVEKTFDGRHPCVLCLVVKEGEEKQKEQKSLDPVPVLKAILAPNLWMVGLAFTLREFPPFEEKGWRRAEPPPVQPPRLA
jgi:hypothetical protein